MKNKNYDIMIIALAIHIFTVNIKLLYHLNPESPKYVAFSFLNLNEYTIVAMIVAIGYSIATLRVLASVKNNWLIYLFALMDGIGVLLYYNPDVEKPFKASYFALYTFLLIISTTYIKNSKYLSDQVIELKQKGVTQREIAQKLNVSESMVSRMLKRVQE